MICNVTAGSISVANIVINYAPIIHTQLQEITINLTTMMVGYYWVLL